MSRIAIAKIPPGSVLDIDFGPFRHRVIAGYLAWDGKPALISATARTGTVLEEPWDRVVQGREVTLISVPESEAVGLGLVMRARQYIRQWRYNLFDRNCEHFVSLVLEGRPNSPQLWIATLSLVALFLGAAAVARS